MRITPSLQRLHRSRGIGFIGLGAMGQHMFKNLVVRSAKSNAIQRPHFVICDPNPKAVSDALSCYSKFNSTSEIQTVDTPQELASEASTIISMVPTSKHVREVYLGKKGVLSAFDSLDTTSLAETIIMDGSTIEQADSIDIAHILQEAGAEMVDAPVSGGVSGARDGTLTIMVGGSAVAFKRANPILQYMARRVVHCGEQGAGLAAKIANNMLVTISMMGVAEAMLLGKKLGLEPQMLADIINTSTGRCWASEVNNPVPGISIAEASPPALHEYVGGFALKLAHKDLKLALAAAESVSSPIPLGTLTEETYRPLAQPQSEYSNLDFSAIYKHLESL